MTYANPIQRQELITGLRALADFLESKPEVPVPPFTDMLVFPPHADDNENRLEIDIIASRICSETGLSYSGRHYMTSRRFGPRRVSRRRHSRRREQGAITMNAFWIILAASPVLLLAAVAFLVLIIIGVRKGDRGDLSSPPSNRIDAITRRVVGVGVRNNADDGKGDS
jgi:hypothetical protein